MKTLTLIIVVLLLISLANASKSNCKKKHKTKDSKKKCQRCESSSSSSSGTDSRTYSTSDVERLGLGRVIYRADEPGVPGIFFPDNPFADNSYNDPASYYESLPNNPFNRPPATTPNTANSVNSVSPANATKPACPSNNGSNNGVSPSNATLRPPSTSKPAVPIPSYGGSNKPYSPSPNPPPNNINQARYGTPAKTPNNNRTPCASTASVGNNNQTIPSPPIIPTTPPTLNNPPHPSSIVSHNNNGGCCHHEEPELPDMNSLYLDNAKQQQPHHYQQYSPQLTRAPVFDPAWTVQPSSWPGYSGWPPYVPPNPFHQSHLPHQPLQPPFYVSTPNGAQILLNDDYQISVGGKKASSSGNFFREKRKQFNVDDSDVCAGFGGLYLITKDIPLGYETDACGMANGRPADVFEGNIRDVIKTITRCLSGLVETVRVRQYFGERVRGMVLSVDRRYGPGVQHHKDYSAESQPVLCRIKELEKKKKNNNNTSKSSSKRKDKSRRRRKNRKVSSDSSSTTSSSSSSSSCSS